MKNRGFTLIEVLVIVAIVGILGALIIGAITGKAEASTRGCGGWFEPRCSSTADEAKTAAL